MNDVATAPAPDAPVLKQRTPPPPSLPANALRSAVYEQLSYVATVPADTTFDRVMTPSYWQNWIRELSSRPFARIWVQRSDGTMFLELICLSAKPGMAQMLCKWKYVNDENLTRPPTDGTAPGDQALELPAGYKWAHVPNGADKGHMVRLPNGDVLVKGLPSKLAAVARAVEHFRVANTPTI